MLLLNTENKTLLIVFAFVMCNVYTFCNVYFVLIFYNKDKIITKLFFFTHFGLNIRNTFYICYLKKALFYNSEICSSVMLKQLEK